MPTAYESLKILFDIMKCETLNGHEGIVSIGGRRITYFRCADDIVVNAAEEEETDILVDHYNIHNGDWS